MNKLILGALVLCAVLALTDCVESKSSLELSDSLLSREVREAATKEGKKSGKKNRVVKGGKQRKNANSGKERNQKKTTGRKLSKGRKNSRKSEKKSAKNQNNRKKGRSGKKVKKPEKSGKSNGGARQSPSGTCDGSTVLLAVTYLNLLNNKVKNFLTQSVRIGKFAKLSANKAGKNTTYLPSAQKLVDIGGGNASNLLCQGNASLPGTAQLKSAYDTLSNCSAQINQACGSFPAMNQSTLDANNATMATFSALVNACLAPNASCTCWASASLKNASAAVSAIDITALNTNATNSKKACTTAVSSCNQAVSTSAFVQYSCSPANSPSALIAKLGAATANQKALETLLTASNNLGTTRQALPCGTFASSLSSLAALALQSPSGGSVAATANNLNTNKPTSCSAEDKTGLKAALGLLSAAISAIISFIATLQANLQALTGTTASPAVISAAPTAAPAGPTTAKPGSGSGSGKKNLAVDDSWF